METAHIKLVFQLFRLRDVRARPPGSATPRAPEFITTWPAPIPTRLQTEETCDVGEFVGRRRRGDTNDAWARSLQGVVERLAVVQRRHMLDMRSDRIEL
jgi:hypothetical protein